MRISDWSSDVCSSDLPFARIGKESVTVQITSVVRASDTSFNVRWTERRYVNGAAAGLERWTAVVSIVLQPPRTEERLRKNPLGIYVNGLSWSRELDSSEGAKRSEEHTSEIQSLMRISNA